jgi:hypothetical protein
MERMIASVHDGSWLSEYKRENEAALAADPEFAAWLEHEYVPLVGGWQY